MFSDTSQDKSGCHFLDLLFSITSQDDPSFFNPPFFRLPSPCDAISIMISTRCILVENLRISPKSSCFHAHRGFRGILRPCASFPRVGFLPPLRLAHRQGMLSTVFLRNSVPEGQNPAIAAIYFLPVGNKSARFAAKMTRCHSDTGWRAEA